MARPSPAAYGPHLPLVLVLAALTTPMSPFACVAQTSSAVQPGAPTGPAAVGAGGSVPSAASAPSATIASAGSGRIKGVITDGAAGGGAGVADAVVYLDNAPDVRTKTANDGSFELQNVPAGQHQLVAVKGDFKVRTPAAIAQDAPSIDVKSLLLRRTGSITGVVRRAGANLLGTDVFIPGSTMIAKCKENGAYGLIGVAEGTYRVAVVRPGDEPKILEVGVKAGQNAQLDFDLEPAAAAAAAPTATFKGVVVGSKGKPVEGVRAAILGAGNFGSLTDETGAFTISGVPGGEHTVYLYRDFYKSQKLPRSVSLDGKPGPVVIDLGTIALTPAPQDLPVGFTVETTVTTTTTITPGGGPLVLDQQNPAPPPDIQHLVPFGRFPDDDQKFGQPFVPTRSGAVTGVAFPLVVEDTTTPAPVMLSLFEAAASGQPTGAALGTVNLPSDRINRPIGEVNWVDGMFAAPVPVSAGKKYVALLTCETKAVNVLVTPASVSAGLAVFSSRAGGAEAWYQVNAADGFNTAAFRLYVRE